jgi:hypothetical protein
LDTLSLSVFVVVSRWYFVAVASIVSFAWRALARLWLRSSVVVVVVVAAIIGDLVGSGTESTTSS